MSPISIILTKWLFGPIVIVAALIMMRRDVPLTTVIIDEATIFVVSMFALFLVGDAIFASVRRIARTIYEIASLRKDKTP